MSTIYRIDPNADFHLIGSFGHAVEESAREEMLAGFVDEFEDDNANGDTIHSYAVDASFDAYPVKFAGTKERIDFRNELKARLKNRQPARRAA